MDSKTFDGYLKDAEDELVRKGIEQPTQPQIYESALSKSANDYNSKILVKFNRITEDEITQLVSQHGGF